MRSSPRAAQGAGGAFRGRGSAGFRGGSEGIPRVSFWASPFGRKRGSKKNKGAKPKVPTGDGL
eukprot:1703063-Alexandrium_andersonii.AAC.1